MFRLRACLAYRQISRLGHDIWAGGRYLPKLGARPKRELGPGVWGISLAPPPPPFSPGFGFGGSACQNTAWGANKIPAFGPSFATVLYILSKSKKVKIR